MNGLKTNNAPHISVVIPHFVFGALSLLLLAVLLFMSGTKLLEAYFNQNLIAITHIVVLGWASTIIFGALYQLIPVVFETALFSELLAKITFWVFVSSFLFLVYAFWTGSFTLLLPIAACSMFIAVFLFALNVLLSYKKAKKKSRTSKFVIVSIIWFVITAFIGLLMALNFKYNFLTEVHLHYLKIHAAAGFIGWFLMLIIGVGSVLIPMFLISHNISKKPLNYTYYLSNSGLTLLIINWFLIKNKHLTSVSWLLIALGVLFFMFFLIQAYKKRLRKKLDIGMQYSFIAITSLLLPLIISFILKFYRLEFELLNNLTIFYGFSVMFGFITTLILGQTYKTLPFIVWLNKYKSLVGKIKTPLPKELYNTNIANIQFIFYLAFVLVEIIGILANNLLLVTIGNYIFLVVAILYNINIFYIILHKVKPSAK